MTPSCTRARRRVARALTVTVNARTDKPLSNPAIVRVVPDFFSCGARENSIGAPKRLT